MAKKGNILLVEDDLSIGSILFDLIKQAGYSVKWAKDGIEGLSAFSQDKYTCLLLDVMMPRKNGFELLAEVREVDKEVPVIMLTAKSEILDKKEAFSLGADDYVVKPFEWEELELRLASKHRDTSTKSSDIPLSNAIFNPEKQVIIYKSGIEQRLTGRESQILHLLYKKKNEALENDTILNHIWGINTYKNSRSLDVFISRLRSYLKELEEIEIKNIHGKGYALLLK